jgi:hypothetical protein
MKRTFATTFAIALLGVGACKGGSGDAVKLVPDSATFIGGVDIAALQKSDLWNDNKKYLEEGEAKETLDAAKACNLGLDKWKSVTFGMHHSAFGMSGDDPPPAVVVFSADGIGKKENLECVQGKVKEKTGEEPWTMEEKDGRLVLDIDEGKDVGYVVNDNTLVVVGKGWADSVKELIDGKGKPAVDNSLKDAVGTADTSKAVWFAGNLPSEMLAGSPAEGAKTAAGSVDLKSGLAFALAVTFGSADDATSKAAELQSQFDQVKGMAGAMGVPQTVTDSVKIEAKGSAVNVSASLTTEDVKKLQETAAKAGGGF